MKIIVDENVPYLKGVLEPFAEVVCLPGREITRDVVRNADALIIRTRTLCNEKLLKDSSVKFIASATIGADHIDADYCRSRGIAWCNAPGCNAGAVCQYVAAALLATARMRNAELRGRTIGIVGVGHVGSRVAVLCRALGMNVLLNDPPRQQLEGDDVFTDLARIRREADFISFHVPLVTEGAFATRHMVDEHFLAGLAKSPLLINTCRGEVFDSGAVKQSLDAGLLTGVVIDCWEKEPEIDRELLDKTMIGTPHIAGYSEAGKAKGTTMCVQALSRFFHLRIDDWEPPGDGLQKQAILPLDGYGKETEALLAEAVLKTYDILADDRRLRADPGAFERLREQYLYRKEFLDFAIVPGNLDTVSWSALRKIGFRVICDQPGKGADRMDTKSHP